jgi:hypothetical protein
MGQKFTSYANAKGTIESRIKRQESIDRALGIDPAKKRSSEPESGIVFSKSDKATQKPKN